MPPDPKLQKSGRLGACFPRSTHNPHSPHLGIPWASGAASPGPESALLSVPAVSTGSARCPARQTLSCLSPDSSWGEMTHHTAPVQGTCRGLHPEPEDQALGPQPPQAPHPPGNPPSPWGCVQSPMLGETQGSPTSARGLRVTRHSGGSAVRDPKLLHLWVCQWGRAIGGPLWRGQLGLGGRGNVLFWRSCYLQRPRAARIAPFTHCPQVYLAGAGGAGPTVSVFSAEPQNNGSLCPGNLPGVAVGKVGRQGPREPA